MRFRLPGLAALAGIGVLAAAAGVPAAASVPATAVATADAVPALAGSAPQAGTRQVLLLNGDRVLAGPAGAGAILPPAGSRTVSPVMSLRLGAKTYDTPSVALPYLGRGLDLQLFSVQQLETAEQGGRLPVQVSYSGRVPALPGVTVTHAAGGTAQGYLTAASAQAFGAALARQARADHQKGSYGTDGMFASGAAVTLAGTSEAQPVQPDFPMHTLTVKATNLAGKPDTGDFVQLLNVDNPNRTDAETNFGHFFHGQAKFSVPAGHYFAMAGFGADFSHVVFVPQFTVAGNDTTVTTNETTANQKITMVTPRPSNVADTDLWLHRTVQAGPSITVEFITNGSISINRTQTKPTVGTIQESVNEHLESPPGKAAYEYTLSYTSPPGVIPGQRYVARPRDLARLTERIYQPVTTNAQWSFGAAFPSTDFEDWPGFVEPELRPMRIPGHLTEYAGGNNLQQLIWSGEYTPDIGVLPFLLGSPRRLHPGEHVTDSLGAFPLHPAPNALPAGTRMKFFTVTPSAVRSGNTVRLNINAFDDNQPGDQVGTLNDLPGHKASGNYQIDVNGKKTAGGTVKTTAGLFPPQYTFSAHAPLGTAPARVRLSLNLARTDSVFRLSTATHTTWSWRTAPAAGAKLPQGWSCAPFTRNRKCKVQPMMTLRYQVARMGLAGSAPAGQQAVHVQVGHLQLASAARITHASVQVSFDGGKTWHRARVTGHGGDYTAVFTAPAGVKVSLRTSAADTAGGHISETIISGYKIAS